MLALESGEVNDVGETMCDDDRLLCTASSVCRFLPAQRTRTGIALTSGRGPGNPDGCGWERAALAGSDTDPNSRIDGHLNPCSSSNGDATSNGYVHSSGHDERECRGRIRYLSSGR
jgi:hypothetical protein